MRPSEALQSALHPAGPQAERLHELYWLMLVVCSAVFAAVMVFVVLAVLVPPGADAQRGRRRRVLAVASATGATAVILIAFLVRSVWVSRELTAAPVDPVRIEVTGHMWWWEVTYPAEPPSDTVRTANELHIPVGRPVEVTLRSRDVIHSFWIPSLHGKMDAIPGRETRLWFEASQPGELRGQCAEFCGLQHAKMAFLVIAEPEEAFSRWLEAQRKPAAPPTTAGALAGQQVFLSSECVMCHAVRGTDALAAAGPDLTHLASRRTLAAGILANRRGQLAGWISDPQHVKPGAFMPAIPIEGERLNALLDYLESLK